MSVSKAFLRTVDDWRRDQVDLPSRAEAIRRMVELAAKMKKRQISISDGWAAQHPGGKIVHQ
jgi:hypothetical protein